MLRRKKKEEERAAAVKKKQELLEWEKSFQTRQLPMSKNEAKKKELLNQLWNEQNQIGARVHQIQDKKMKEKEQLLASIVQLDEHSRALIEKITNWQAKQNQQKELLETYESGMNDMFLRYDAEYDLKRSQVIKAMEETLKAESARFACVEDLKDLSALEVRQKLFEQENIQRQAFEIFQRERDFRHSNIISQIKLIENELYNLTQAELQRKDDKLGEILDDIAQQRARLASLLARLLAEKETRERELHNYLNDMEARRREIEDDDFWLVQYQRLMEQTSVESQLSKFQIDERIAAILKECDESKIVHYVPLFANMQYDQFVAMTEKDLTHLGIDDFTLCMDIRDKIDEAGDGRDEMRPQKASAPDLSDEDDNRASAPPLEVPSAPPSSILARDIKLWCQPECVVCLDKDSNEIFLPCGHVCCCSVCAAPITHCPLCRVAIENKQSISL